MVIESTTKAIPFIRVGLGLLYIWFGLLKMVRASPIMNLIPKMALRPPKRIFVGWVGLLELIVGVSLLFRVTLRLLLFLTFFELANTLLLAKQGKSILKNLALLVAGLGVATLSKRNEPEAALPHDPSSAPGSSRRYPPPYPRIRQPAPRSQVFPRRTNILARASLVGTLFLVAGVGLLGYLYVRSPYATGVDTATGQPVPFSHQHHVDTLNLDCRYCHSSVMVSSSAGMPSTHTCMTCHSQIWSNSAWLAPVRTSWQLDTPLDWNRVYDLPDHVYFDHSIHVTKGVGCETCHGRVDQMPLIWQAESLQMTWCLECHRQPSRFLRPAEAVLTMGYQPEEEQSLLGEALVHEYQTPVERLTDCYTCHR